MTKEKPWTSALQQKAPQLDSSIDTKVNLIDLIDQPKGVHKIKTTLLSISLPKVRELQLLALESTNYDYESVSLTDILNTSFLKWFGDTIYSKTPSNTFVPICNFDKPLSATQCFVKTNDIVIDPIPEYFNDNISPCDSNACLTCNIFISDQSFKSNLTGRIYKTQTYEQLTCGSSNVVYAIHCIRCGLMYVGETGRSLRSRINEHQAGIIKDGQSLLYKHFRLPGH